MQGRAALVSFVAGSSVVHTLQTMPAPLLRVALLAAGLVASILFCLGHLRGTRFRVVVLCIGMALLGFASTTQRVQHRIQDRLLPSNEAKVTRVVLQIVSLVQIENDQRRFNARVLSSRPTGVPSLIQVSWSAPGWAGPYGKPAANPASFPVIMPGQIWRMALTLKTPSGLRNPGAFDYEAFQFAKGIRATGAVRGVPVLVGDEPFSGLSVLAERTRHYVRENMQPFLQGKRYGGVMLALAIGDQNSIPDHDWKTFNAVAVTHAVVVSGGHITMVAALGGLLTLYLWRRGRWRGVALAERCPAQVASALAALLVAWLYCLLAGWGVPAQRTFLMLAVVACAYVARVPATSSRIFCLAAFAVVLFDPWSVFATGFWLSFGAVYILMAANGAAGFRTRQSPPGRLLQTLRSVIVASRLQLVITMAMLPALAYLFNEVSLVSPLANAYVIPLLGLVVTPAALLLAAVSTLPGVAWLCQFLVWLGHGVLEWMMVPTTWLAQLPAATLAVAAGPLWLGLLAALGVILATQLHGLRLRHVGWLLVLPMLLWQPAGPGPGYWRLTALDVGQGSAIVIQTHQHTVLVDTGLRSSPSSDAGLRVIVPYLKSMGVRRLSALVVSHADIDHAGGLLSVVQAIPVDAVYASFDVERFLRREVSRLSLAGPPPKVNWKGCHYGMNWHLDQVSFAFLWPAHTASNPQSSGARNAAACVLRIQGIRHAALLPGDIGNEQERALVGRGVPATDLVVAAHHGSRHSSSVEWVNRMAAQHVIAQVGHANRYGHPAPQVQHRWQQSGARFWRTDHHGAVHVVSGKGSLLVRAQRDQSRRYWHAR